MCHMVLCKTIRTITRHNRKLFTPLTSKYRKTGCVHRRQYALPATNAPTKPRASYFQFPLQCSSKFFFLLSSFLPAQLVTAGIIQGRQCTTHHHQNHLTLAFQQLCVSLLSSKVGNICHSKHPLQPLCNQTSYNLGLPFIQLPQQRLTEGTGADLQCYRM